MKTETKFIPSLNDTVEFKIGQNAQDNFDIIDASNPNDLWFHLYGESSCHVIASMNSEIKLDKKQKRQIITQGALLCKQNSRHKSSKDVNIIYTEIKNIEKTETIGSVHVNSQKNILV
tara:strand:- start:2024 stop:2377 length:354 start_codon:yes stop_codon:yes gene_type:complete